MGRTKQKGGSFKGKKYQRSKKRKQQGGFFNLPALLGSLFAPKRAAPRRRPQPPRRPPPPRPNYATQNRRHPQRRRQEGGFITDSVNYGFDEQSTQKKRTKQKGGSVLPLNKIPWVKRVHLS
jgi:hypothetical protein